MNCINIIMFEWFCARLTRVYIYNPETLYISGLQHAFKPGKYVLLESINTILTNFFMLSDFAKIRWGSIFGAWALSFGTCYEVDVEQLCASSINKIQYLNVVMPKWFCTMWEKCTIIINIPGHECHISGLTCYNIKQECSSKIHKHIL